MPKKCETEQSPGENFEDFNQRMEDEEFMGDSIRNWIQFIRETAADDSSDSSDTDSDSNTKKSKSQSHTDKEKKKKTAWYCDICDDGKNYTKKGKLSHIKTEKHNQNADLVLYHMDKALRWY